MTLRIDRLCKSYDDRRVVDDVCLEVRSGEVFGLLGPNGAGKTTTMSIVAGLVEADSGQVLLDDKPLDTRDPERRRVLGIVPQELAIYPELTGRENLSFFGSLHGFGGAELRGRVDRVLEQVGLTDHAGRAAGTYSGGMKRRLNFGAAILHEPKLVILDEPTVGVDPQSRSHLLDVVRSLGSSDTIVIYASHYMEEVEAVCARAAIMDQGKVIVCDRLDELLGRVGASATIDVDSWNHDVAARLGNVVTVTVNGAGRRLTVTPQTGTESNSAGSSGAGSADVGRELARAMSILTEAHLPITRVETHDASLERLFLELTGRRLRGIQSRTCSSAAEALDAIHDADFDVILTDVRMPGTTGLQLCQQLSETRPDIPVIVMTAFGTLETAVSAMRSGAYDFITKPIEMDLLSITLRRAIEKRRLTEQVRLLEQSLPKRGEFGELLGQSPAMVKLSGQLQQVAASDAAVLITGESGTGKELVARSIHADSRRASRPFVAVNCGALSESLLESELFGHVKGAFTDARSVRRGLFLEADGGVLLLDEMGDMPMSMQVKLLRALEERTVRPVGSDRETPFDVRVLTATNRDLEAAVAEGRFREDLYYRINVIGVELPPLRSRGTDILRLAEHFAQQFASSENKPISGLAEGVAEKLLGYSWPGNVRELRNVMERAVALTLYDRITLEDLPEKVRNFTGGTVFIGGLDPAELVSMEDIERRYITHVLEACSGNQTQAARILGLDRKTIYRKLKQC